MGALFTQPYRGRCGAMAALSPMGALRRYGAVQPYGGAAALWGGAGPNLWGRKAAPRMCGAAGGAHSAVPRRADVAVTVPAALRAPTVGDVITQ